MLLAQGLTLARLCEAANISMATAKSHVYHIYQKMDVHSRKELAAVVMATRIEQASADGPTHPKRLIAVDAFQPPSPDAFNRTPPYLGTARWTHRAKERPS